MSDSECEVCGTPVLNPDVPDAALCDRCYNCSASMQERLGNSAFYKYIRDLRKFAEYRDSLVDD